MNDFFINFYTVYLCVDIYLVKEMLLVREGYYHDMPACDRVPWQWTQWFGLVKEDKSAGLCE